MEQKKTLRTNLTIIGLVALLIAAVLIVGRFLPKQPEVIGGDITQANGLQVTMETAAVTEIPAVSPDPTDESAPKAWLVVSVDGVSYEPIPLRAPGRFTVTRGDHVNIIEVTETSVRMAEASCDNQDCVMQGVVSLENMAYRVYQNMIICLPNEVVLYLYSPEQLAEAVITLPEVHDAAE